MARRASLRRRLLVWLLPTILALSLVWLWAAYAIVIHFVNIAYDRSLEDSVETIGKQVQVSSKGFSIDLPPAARRMLEFDRVDRIYYLIIDDRNRSYLGNAAVPAPQADAPNAHGNVFYNAVIEGRNVRVVQTSIRRRDGGQLSIRVAETRQKRGILAHEVMTYMVAPQSLFLAGIIVLIWIGVGRGVAPLARVRDRIAGLDPKDLRQIEEEILPSELAEQVSVINGLIARLADVMAAQQRFIADASHQLRTPVTNIRMQVELALRANAHEDMRAMLGKIDVTSSRLVRLTGQLLTLSRIEASDPDNTRFEQFPIEDTITNAIAWSVPGALLKNVEIIVDVPRLATHFYGDHHAIEQLVSNLVDNAVRYTSHGGHVIVKVASADPPAEGIILLTVEDDGPGIAGEYRDRVLGRFHRGPQPSGKGTGLGLSIASEVVRLHRGSLRLCHAQPSGLRVLILLPFDFRLHAKPDGFATIC